MSTFCGKVVLAHGESRVRLDGATQTLTVGAETTDGSDRFNCYGDDTALTLQAANGKFVTWTGTAYRADLSDETSAHRFRWQQVDGGIRVLDLGPDPGQPGPEVWRVDGSSLTRTPDPGGPPASGPSPATVFARTVVTPGLAEILTSGLPGPHADLRWVDLEGVDLSEARLVLDRSLLDDARLAGVTFPESLNLHLTSARRADLTGAALVQAMITNAELDGCTLDGADLRGVDLSHTTLIKASARGTDLSGLLRMTGASFDGATLSGALLIDAIHIADASFVGADLSGADFTGAWVNGRLDLSGANLSRATLANPEDEVRILPGRVVLDSASVCVSSTLARIDLSGSDLSGINFSRADLSGCVLVGCNLTRANLGFADLTGADLSGSVRLHGANLSSATLREVDLTGAQLGALGGDQQTSPAVLSNADLVDANLDGANLYGVRASGAQLYGTAGRRVNLNRATITGLQLNNANLGSIDLSQATVSGVNFDYAVLTGASFVGADIAVDETGVQTSFNGANLQGASFDSATLKDVILANAAVAGVDGVWLFRLPAEQARVVCDQLTAAATGFTLPGALVPHLQQAGPAPKTLIEALGKKGVTLGPGAILVPLTTELSWRVEDGSARYVVSRAIDDDYRPALGVAAGDDPTGPTTHYLPLSLEGELRNGPVADAVRMAFDALPLPLGPTASVTTVQQPCVWQVVDDATVYTLWTRFVSSVKGVATLVQVRTTIPNVTAAFGAGSIPLSDQAMVTAAGQGRWSIANRSDDPFNPTHGYIEFIAVRAPEGELDVYGSMIRFLRSRGTGEQEFVNLPCTPTVLSQAVLDQSGNSICPNGASVEANKIEGLAYSHWLRARFLARPPVCIPDPQGQFYCHI